MLAVAGPPPDVQGWAVEMKWDGARIMAVCAAGECRLYSRNGRDVGGSYPELVAALRALVGERTLILDAEVIAADADGAPSFGRLQRRMHVARPGEQLVAEVPVQLFAFDVLAVGARDVTGLPYLERRRLLAELPLTAPLSAPPHWLGVEAGKLLAVAREHRLEGIVSKRVDSPYLPGRRSPAWIKTPLRRSTEVIVCGWTPGSGGHQHTFGSLVLGAHDATGTLVYIGNVGTGFTQAVRRVLRAALDDIALPASPFATAPPLSGRWHWVRPILVGDVEYREFTDRLRMPSWKGLRSDKTAAEVLLPETATTPDE
ncbi:Putative DNA ligase-like protein Rv0938/MT0965 [Nocardia otitidiscaviarum]|uniref:DNA ligase (ATP) n=1 Tax=Nocardia otitidiscaviarum TaxID=1823 RepID=A0A379JKF1_9NOCA|nr:non-homologous end-joining DNA ligase [Nocardia otitidiscaviarum]SUD49057.1 Putative DNA ligase-like protein Rv0938/MT0965 [Nocardia otitidiscaviarum]